MQAVARGSFAASAEPFLARTLQGSRAGCSSRGDVGTRHCLGLAQVSHVQLSLKPAQLPLPSLLSLLEFTSTRVESQPEVLLHLQSWSGWGRGLIPRAEQLWATIFSHFRTPHRPSLSAGKAPHLKWHKLLLPESRWEDRLCQCDTLHGLALPADSLFWQQICFWDGSKSPV